MKSLVGQLVVVTWIDAGDLPVNTWCTLTEALEAARDEDAPAVSVGWLLSSDERYIVLAASRIEESSGELTYSQVHRIPRAWGMKITKL